MNASARKTQPREDWHPADIKAALDKKGWSLARIAREYGYGKNSPYMVLQKPWSQIEEIVARIIGVKAADIWPCRYDRRGRPLKCRTARVKAPVRRISNQRTVSNV